MRALQFNTFGPVSNLHLVELPDPQADERSANEALVPLFDQGTFQPPHIDRVLALSDGVAAYQEVASGQLRGRVVLAP